MSLLPERVSEILIESLVDSLEYHVQTVPDTTTTLASAKLPDGFVVATGSAACVSGECFDEKIGVELAIKDAKKKAERKLWELEGYLLRRRKQEYDDSLGDNFSMDFCYALQSLKYGQRVSRRGWNGKGMYLAIQEPDDDSKMTLPYIYMKTACDNKVPWLASQADLLGNDWFVVRKTEK